MEKSWHGLWYLSLHTDRHIAEENTLVLNTGVLTLQIGQLNMSNGLSNHIYQIQYCNRHIAPA